MTTESQTTVETPEVESDKDKNFRVLEEKFRAAEEELKELRPLRDDKTLRDAGFDPDSDRGKALKLAMKAGEVTPSVDEITDYAATTFGWEPQVKLTETEQTQVSGSERLSDMRRASGSEEPPTRSDQIAEAEAAGNWALAGQLKMQQLAELVGQ